MNQYCFRCWKINSIDDAQCQLCDRPIRDKNKLYNEEIMSNLYKDNGYLLKNAFYGLLYSERLLYDEFGINNGYCEIFLQMMSDIIKCLDNPQTIKTDDLSKNEDGRIIRLTDFNLSFDDINYNLIKIFPLIYLKNIDSEVADMNPEYKRAFMESHAYFNILNKSDENKDYYNVYSVISYIFRYFIQDNTYQKINEYSCLSDLMEFIFDRSKIIAFIEYITDSKSKNDIEEYRGNEYLKKLFLNSKSITKEDLDDTTGIINTLYSVAYSLNKNSLKESMKTALKLENELYLTVPLTGIFCGIYYKLDLESHINFKKFIKNYDEIEEYINNFENYILKEQIRNIVKYTDYFNKVRSASFYRKDQTYPVYPREIENFRWSVDRMIKGSDPTYKKYDIFSKYDDEFNEFINDADFHNLKLALIEYIHLENRWMEGMIARSVAKRIYYKILLRFEEYYAFLKLKNLEVPTLSIDYSKSIEYIKQENITPISSLNIEKQSSVDEEVEININPPNSSEELHDDYEEMNLRYKQKYEELLKSELEKYKDDILITLVGMRFYHGNEPFKDEEELELIKEPDNEYDTEAIYVKSNNYGKIAYVANTTTTVHKNTYSAGRIYDKIEDKTHIEIIHINGNTIIAKLIK